MQLVERLYDWLGRDPGAYCDDILSVGLPRAEEPFFSQIAAALAKRSSERSCAALAGCYGRLNPEVKAKLAADPRRLRAGITLALAAPDPQTNIEACAAVRDHPYPQVAFALVDALRKREVDVSRAAGQALRKVAAEFLARPEPAPGAAAPDDRPHLARAFREALRSFDAHCRKDVLETCLWFARELHEDIWEALDARRSTVSAVVQEELTAWNHPWLAGFLLRALGNTHWRGPTRKLLMSWNTAEHLIEVLRETEALNDDELRRQVGNLKNPPWFDHFPLWIDRIPPRLLMHAPTWLCAVGFSLSTRTNRLCDWLNLNQPVLRRAVVYALATLETVDAVEALARVAKESGPLGTFAQWYLAGRHAALPVAEGRAPAHGAEHAEFATLWQNLRRNTDDADRELIAAIRTNLDEHRPKIRALLHSPDPRDRILVLRILGNAGAARVLLTDLRQLLNDPVEGIRHMTAALIRAARDHAAPDAAHPHTGEVAR